MNTSQVIDDLHCVRNQKPLILNITNYVVMNLTANSLLATGASPVMAHALDEIEEMTAISQALVVNVGTLSQPWIQSMKKAIGIASKMKIPIVLDPGGVGATAFRLKTVLELLNSGKVSVIRGNSSEILTLCQMSNEKMKGVDRSDSSNRAYPAAKRLASNFMCTVCVSGKIDLVVSCPSNEKDFPFQPIISDLFKTYATELDNGHEIMSRVTGMGCTASALIAAFLSIQKDHHQATCSAMSIMGIAGEIAAKSSAGPGSFAPRFLDVLYHLSAEEIKSLIRETPRERSRESSNETN